MVFSLHFSSSSSSSSENKKTHRSMERKVQCVVCLRKEEVYRKSAFKSEGEKKVSKALPLSLSKIFVFVVKKKTETKACSFRV